MGRFSDFQHFQYTAYFLGVVYVMNWVAIRTVWTKLPTLTKKEKQRMEEYKKYVKGTSKRSINRSINQAINQSINHSINQYQKQQRMGEHKKDVKGTSKGATINETVIWQSNDQPIDGLNERAIRQLAEVCYLIVKGLSAHRLPSIGSLIDASNEQTILVIAVRFHTVTIRQKVETVAP
eukprot:1179383-Prorocentrum_minimum.AAC.1